MFDKIKKLKEIPIEFVLSKHGIKSFKIVNNTAWYFAFNRIENTASVKVDFGNNRFYDFGIGKGGSVIDVVMQIQKLSLRDAILYLENFDNSIVSEIMIPTVKPKIQNHSITIFKVQSIVHPGLLEYLERRFVDVKITQEFCVQVHYKVGEKKFFGIGFQNDEGGFEIRSKFFKGGSSPKTITSILNGKNELIILEGFFDFLSFLTLNPTKQIHYDFIILNSVSFQEKITSEIINKYDLVYLLFDNDSAGKNAAEQIQKRGNNTFDFSKNYIDNNDINDYLMMKKSY